MAILKIKDKKTGEWIHIKTIKGEKGDTGQPGENGKDYVLTETDIQEIVDKVLDEFPDSEEVSY